MLDFYYDFILTYSKFDKCELMVMNFGAFEFGLLKESLMYDIVKDGISEEYLIEFSI